MKKTTIGIVLVVLISIYSLITSKTFTKEHVGKCFYPNKKHLT